VISGGKDKWVGLKRNDKFRCSVTQYNTIQKVRYEIIQFWTSDLSQQKSVMYDNWSDILHIAKIKALHRP